MCVEETDPASISAEEQLLDQLAAEFTRRKNAGECPQIEDYTAQHPALADHIRDIFPVLSLLNNVAGHISSQNTNESGPSTSGFTDRDIDSDVHIQPGAHLGEYTLIELIGQGGMGVVYSGRHESLGGLVAIKIMTAAAARVDLRERFVREASAASRMSHPNIVRVQDFGTVGSSLYYIMPLIEGCGLDRIIRAARKMAESPVEPLGNSATHLESATTVVAAEAFRPNSPSDSAVMGLLSRRKESRWDWIAKIGIDTADALAYAHGEGVVHRDIKPANLMIDSRGKLFVTDFGLAKVVDEESLTATGDMLGTIRYMPPEAFAGKSDLRGDIYSLGLTLYELVSNRPAFETAERARLIKEIVDGSIAGLTHTAPTAPHDLSVVIHKAVATDPRDRYQSAAELRDDLRCVLDGKPVTARPPSFAYRASRWIRRNRVVSALAACLFIVLAVAAVSATIIASNYKSLANDKEVQRVEAVGARQQAEAAEFEAQRALLKSLVSDAEGWSLRNQVGRRIQGLEQLAQAITLSRAVDQFASYQTQFNEIAVSLSLLDDATLVRSWQHPHSLIHTEPLDFSGDLSVYSRANNYYEVRLETFSLEGDQYKLQKTIPLNLVLNENKMVMSKDSRFIVGTALGLDLFIFDLQSEQEIKSGIKLAEGHSFEIQSDCQTLVALTGDHRCVSISLLDGAIVREYADLGHRHDHNEVTVSRDGRMIAIHRAFGGLLSIFDVENEYWIDLPVASGVQRVSWRPDGTQLAIASDDIRVWDFELKRTIFEENVTHSPTTRLVWMGGGSLLLSSGDDGQTRCFRVAAGREVLRFDAGLVAASDDGRNLILRNGSQFQQYSLTTNDILYQYGVTTDAYSGGGVVADRQLWVGHSAGVTIADLGIDRIITEKHSTDTRLAIDPKQRDLFILESGTGISLLPIQRIDDSSGLATTWKIGPSQPIFITDSQDVIGDSTEPNWDSTFLSNLDLDCSGEFLTVVRALGHPPCTAQLVRGSWNGSHLHGSVKCMSAELNSKFPQLVTRAELVPGIEVFDSSTGKQLFSSDQSPSRSHFTPDGKRLLISAGGAITAYDTTSWQKVAVSDPELNIDSGASFAMSQDGTIIAVESRAPRGVQFLNSMALQPLLFFRGDNEDPDSWVFEEGFDAQNKWLVTRRGSKAVASWNLAAIRTHFKDIGLPWPLGELGSGSRAISKAVIKTDWRQSASPIHSVLNSVAGPPHCDVQERQ